MSDRGKVKRLGEILIQEGAINELQLAQALGDQKQWGGKIGEVLLRLKMLSEDDLAFALQTRLRVKWLSLKELTIHEEVIKQLSGETARKFMVVPVGIDNKTLIVALTDPTDLKTLDTISFSLGMKVKPVIATVSDIQWAVGYYYCAPEQETVAEQPGLKLKPHEDRIKLENYEDRMKTSKLQKKMQEQRYETNLKGLVALLIEKGLITEEELADKISQCGL